ncbi:RNA-binding domain-containing protein [Lonepinella sp. MS14435]|uniref:RNA-binding domain-containing protein n=1 Tax=Lonepinella sp. MS14435 TaxID=3003618 RepID=UPI0036DD9908
MNSFFLQEFTLNELALLKESSELECKSAMGADGKGSLPKDMWESYSALANTNGGYIVLGVQEKKGKFIPLGIPNVEQLKKNLFDIANNRNKVSINLLSNSAVQEFELDGKYFLVIYVRRAKRQEKPVFLNGNPFGNSYRRAYEADQKINDHDITRMLAEKNEESRDSRILENYSLDDLDLQSLRNYRQKYMNLDPTHPWNELDDLNFLKKLNAYRVDRETKMEGLTVAGLLMFGVHTAIQEVFPFYMLDYQEQPEDPTEIRWVDRLTLDGRWSGNLYDFSQRVYRKLTQDLKIPFKIENGARLEDTPVHIALREALVNTLIHADYSDKASISIIKTQNSFRFRNPGLMRVPIDIALKGGEADCRNRILAQMFRYIRFGDQAGSGLPRILSGWKSQHWSMPLLKEIIEPNEQTILMLQMLALYPQEIIEELKRHYGEQFLQLSELERSIAITIYSNDKLDYSQLCTLVQGHSRDITLALVKLKSLNIITSSGDQKLKIYHRPDIEIPTPDNSLGLQLAQSDFVKNPELTPAFSESPELTPAFSESPELTPAFSESPELTPAFSESPELTPAFSEDDKMYWTELKHIAVQVQGNAHKVGRENIINVILQLCSRYITLSDLATLLNKKPDTLRKNYLNVLVKNGKLELAYPTVKNHPKQAYKTKR